MADLTPLERAAFTLRHLEQQPIEAIAEALGQNAAATRHSIFRAVAKMRRALKPLVRT
jgi:RNA polymerase sigma-70 factor (ECF subfamily)